MAKKKPIHKVRNEVLGMANTKSADMDRVWKLNTPEANKRVASKKTQGISKIP
jgi:hypothetical protein